MDKTIIRLIGNFYNASNGEGACALAEDDDKNQYELYWEALEPEKINKQWLKEHPTDYFYIENEEYNEETDDEIYACKYYYSHNFEIVELDEYGDPIWNTQELDGQAHFKIDYDNSI